MTKISAILHVFWQWCSEDDQRGLVALIAALLMVIWLEIIFSICAWFSAGAFGVFRLWVWQYLALIFTCEFSTLRGD